MVCQTEDMNEGEDDMILQNEEELDLNPADLE
jgi:hypothetical protein